MADAEVEEKPAPNVVASASGSIVAPQKFAWALLKDSVDKPKQYGKSVVTYKSLGRDRETRKMMSRETRIAKPQLFLKHGFELTEIEECDKPLPPPPEPVEGEEEAPAEGAEGEAPAEPAEPPVPERWMRCALVWNVTTMGGAQEEMEPCEGTITFAITCPVGDETSCDISVDVAIYSEALAGSEPDLSQWASAEVAAWKALAEKVIYLCPQLVNQWTRPLHQSILKKAKSFSFLPKKLTSSPSAAKLVEAGQCKSSLGYYLNNATKSPSPLPRTTPKMRQFVASGGYGQ